MKAIVSQIVCWLFAIVWVNSTLAEVSVNTHGLKDPLRGAIEDSLAEVQAASSDENVDTYVDSLANLGKLLQAHGLYESAIDVFTRAIEVDTRSELVYYRAISLNEIGLLELALRDFALLVEKEPANPLIWFRYGEALFIDGQTVPAENALEQTLQLDPDHAAALVRLADIRRVESNLEQALDLLARAWKVDSTAGQIAFRIAQIHRQQGNGEEAEFWLKQRNENAPLIDDPFLREVSQFSLSPSFFKSAGRRAWSRNDYEEAIEAYEIALNMGAIDEDTMLDYANMRLIVKKMSGLETFLLDVMHRFPDSARAWFLYGQTLSSDDPIQATEAFTKSLSLSYDTDVHTWLGNHLMRQRNFEAAREAFGQLAESNPSNPYYRFWLALALHRTGDCEIALEHLRTLTTLEPTWGEAHVLETRTQALCGDPQIALADARKLLSVNASTDTRLTMRLAEIAIGATEAGELHEDDLKHPDFKMFSQAVSTRSKPELPFHEDSSWWIPR